MTKDGLTWKWLQKKITEHKRDVSATVGGQSTTWVSFIDDRIAAVIGETPQKANTPDEESESTTLSEEDHQH